MPNGSAPSDPVARRPRVLWVNRSYWPDAEATGQYLTELCEDLADRFEVTVVVGQPNQNPTGAAFRARGRQTRHGVTIRRVWNSRFPKSFLPGRALNLLSFLAGAAVTTLRVPRPDVVVVQSDPPLLCFVGALLQRWRGSRLIVYLQDIYPDLAVALGKIPENRLVQTLRAALAHTYRRADRIIVPGQDMRRHLGTFGVSDERVVCIPNWVDLAQVYPCRQANPFRLRYGLEDRFVVMYSGNLGLCQPLDEVLQAAALLRERRDIVFLLIGDGVSRKSLERTAQKQSLENVRFLPYQPKAELAQSLSAANLQLVAMDPRVMSYVMPSKIYGILASGSPALVIAPEPSELASLVRRWEVGWVVPPGKPADLAEAICRAAGSPQRLAAMGIQARQLAETHFGRRCCTDQVAALLEDVLRGTVQETTLDHSERSEESDVFSRDRDPSLRSG